MSPQAGARIAFAAGESSGDLLASLVLPALGSRLPQARCAGIGGDRMADAGFETWWHVRELSVRGYAEVLRHLPRLLRLRRALVRRVLRWPADVFVGVDAPDFNLGVEARLRAAGMRTVHYVSPSIWAWRPGRIEAIRAAVDHMLLVFPFEQPLYAAAGVRATYIGHPLATAIPMQPDAAAARRRLGLPLRPTVVAVLPGSRSAEVELLGPAFCEAAAALQRHDASLRIALPAADAALLAALGPMLARAGADLDRTVLLQGRAHDVLEAADAVLVAGGTATLEAMLFKRPMVIAYRVPRLTEWITLRKAIIPYFGLPNVLCARYCVPEFLQEAVTGPALTRALLRLLDDDGERMRLHEEFDRQHEALRRDTAGLFAQAVAQAAEEARR